MDFIGPLIEIIKCCAPIVRNQLDFLCYKENLEKLKKKLNLLYALRNRIKDKIQPDDPKQHVAHWLDSVGKLEREHETETNTDTADSDAGSQKCFKGLCVDGLKRYKMNEIVKREASRVSDLMKEGEIYDREKREDIANPIAVECINIDFGHLETDLSVLVMEKIINALANESVKAVGVWGMGGVGKTELVTRVNNSLKDNKLFDKVIMVTISRNPNWETIRKQIAKRLGLVLENKNEGSQISELISGLKKHQSVLFILDGVWEDFEVSKVGIQEEMGDVKCKIIITTRDQSVCDQMRVRRQEQFELNPMTKDDSWKLFRAMAECVAPALQSIAKKVCAKCGGLPLAICTVASKLRGNERKTSWEIALKKLELSNESGILEEYLRRVFDTIELSFAHLKVEDDKICFFYCCFVPEGHEISKDSIRNYAISQKVIKEISLKDAADWVDDFSVRFRNCSLFIDSDPKFVRVHEFVRRVAIWFATKNGYGFVVNSSQQFDQLLPNENLYGSQHLSVSTNEIKKLPDRLCWESLSALDMSGSNYNHQLEIPNSFFTETKNLLYLDISGFGIPNVPKSLSNLVQLCALDMTGCMNLSDISCLGKLECLKILILDGTGICKLPKELGNLKYIRMLHLKDTHKLKRVAANIFNRMIDLEELNMENSFSNWEFNGKTRNNASLSEIFGLHKLTILHLDIINPLCLKQEFACPSFNKLEKFRIVVGNSKDCINTRFERSLNLSIISSILGGWIRQLFELSEYVNISRCDELSTFLYILKKDSPYLKELKISNFSLIQDLITGNLIDVIDGNLIAAEGNPLNKIELYYNYIFYSSDPYLTQGEEPLDDPENTGNTAFVTEQVEEHFNYLENVASIDSSTEQAENQHTDNRINFGNTTSVTEIVEIVEKLDNLENAGNTAVEEHLTNLENVGSISSITDRVNENPENFVNTISVTEIVEQFDDLENASVTEQVEEHSTNLENVGSISAVTEQGKENRENFGNTTSVTEIGEQLDNLEEVEEQLDDLEYSDSFTQHEEEHWDTHGSNIDTITGALFLNLTHLQIHNCKSLKNLFMGSMSQSLKNLTDIQIHGCNQLLSVMDGKQAICFQKLKSIEVKDCGQLISLLPEAEWKSLETIWAARCRNLKNVIRGSTLTQNLKTLKVEECDKLTSEVSSIIKLSVSSIETVEIFKCNPGKAKYLLSTREIDDVPNKNAFANLRVLKVDGFDGEGIFNGPISQCSLQNLVEVEVKNCNQLTNIWSSEVDFKSLKPLKTLIIGYCDKLDLKEVFLRERLDESFALKIGKLVFEGFSQVINLAFLPEESLQYVKTLQLFSCKILFDILPDRHSCKLKSLESLAINNCPFLAREVTLVCGKLEKLTLQSLPDLETFTMFIFAVRYGVIKILACRKFKIFCSSMEAEIFCDLKELVIYDCPNLSSVIHEAKSQHEQFNSASTQNIFGNLKFLFIGDCHKLKSIFSISIARSLVNLECICVVNCDEVTEIVALSNSAEKELVHDDLFPCLKFVTLFWLPMLRCFCKGYHTRLLWRSLEYVSVWGCPHLVTFGMGRESAPNIKEITGQKEWFKKLKKESSFCSRSFIPSMTLWRSHDWCRGFDYLTDSTTYTLKIEGSCK